MKSLKIGRALAAAALISLGAVTLPGCGGGGVSVALTFSLLDVSPDQSVDLNGGDAVRITGSNFTAAVVAGVLFGGFPGQNFQFINDTVILVTSPPAPGGVAGVVDIEVVSIEAGSKFIISGFTYNGLSGPPAPTSITPTTFTPTGAEDFSIQGTDLGPASGTVQVTFQGIGTVTGTVSANSQFVTGRAPMHGGVPPQVPITVTVANGALTGDVPTQVAFPFTAPISFVVPGQNGTPGESSQPVRVADGYAVMCAAGPDAAWGTADDEFVIISGPPGLIGVNRVTVGYLHQRNSIPAVLDGNTVALYSSGPVAAPGVDDRILTITTLQSAPVVNTTGIGYLHQAPLVAIASNRIAFCTAGTGDTLFGNLNDEVEIWELTGGFPSSTARSVIGSVDVVTFGAANFSRPVSFGGDLVFVVSVGAGGPGGGPGGPNDAIAAFSFSANSSLPAVLVPFLVRRPVALSATVIAGLAGQGAPSPSSNDALNVITAGGGVLTRTVHALNKNTFPFSPLPIARLGGATAGVLGAGPINEVRIFTNPTAGLFNSTSFTGTPLMAPLGSGNVIVFGPGTDGIVNSPPDEARFLTTSGTVLPFAVAPLWAQNYSPSTDLNRAFATGSGLGFLTGTETLIVLQSRAVGTTIDAATLPLGINVTAPVAGTSPFIPVGPGWGVIQSPGQLGTFLDANDRILIARY